MSSYFVRKVAESTAAAKELNSVPSTKAVHLSKISPLGTPVKIESNIQSSLRITPTNFGLVKDEPDTPSSSISRDFSDLEEIYQDEEYIQIAHLKSQFKEFTHVFPAFPKTHVNGFANIIELSEEILNDKALLNLRDSLQYSLTGGGGPKVNENVKFFAKEGEKVPMKIHFRQCAGNFSIQ